MTNYFFIRHGDNSGSELTKHGRDEARALNPALTSKGVDFNKLESYSADNMQSMASVALLLMPSISDGEIKETVERLVKTDVIKPDPRLRYTKFGKGDEQIAEEFQKAYDAGETMKFYVNRSDEFLMRNPELSTYTTISHVMANILLSKNATSDDKLYCPKGFFWPTLRARLLELKSGIPARDDYISWYCSTKELKDEARMDIAVVSRTAGKYSLDDPYGTLEFGASDLAKIEYIEYKEAG